MAICYKPRTDATVSKDGLLLVLPALLLAASFIPPSFALSQGQAAIGVEVAIPRHLQDGDEYEIPTHQLIDFPRAGSEASGTFIPPLSLGTVLAPKLESK